VFLDIISFFQYFVNTLMHSETTKFWLKDAKMTHNLGASLVRSLHVLPLTILLDGELGSGKTTFLQGFASALGVKEPVSSPTFALEQRYSLSPKPT
jgi:tRNA threonylcarbamoyladenosine biosynthesis protein TsaE